MTRQPRRRGRWLTWLVLAALVALAVYFFGWGGGFGLGKGRGDGDGAEKDKRPASADERSAARRGALDAPARCHLRLDASGLHLDGASATLAQALDACRVAGGADLIATGDARFGALEDTKRALEAAGVRVFVRDPAAAPQR